MKFSRKMFKIMLSDNMLSADNMVLSDNMLSDNIMNRADSKVLTEKNVIIFFSWKLDTLRYFCKVPVWSNK
jgi:hypothetical protein